MEGGQARAERGRDRHDASCRKIRDIDDIGALQDGGRAGLLEALAEFFHQRLRALDPALRGEIGEAEIEHGGREEELAAGLLHIAEAAQRAQDAAGGGARQAGLARHLRQRHRRPLPPEQGQHAEPLGERRHELLVVAFGDRRGMGVSCFARHRCGLLLSSFAQCARAKRFRRVQLRSALTGAE